MRFFADQCVPNSVVRALMAAGHDVLRLRDHLPVESPDRAVLAEADRLGAVLVSLDTDFADIVRYPPQQHGGIVVLLVQARPERLPPALERLTAWLATQTEPPHGRLCIVEPHRIRIRA